MLDDFQKSGQDDRAHASPDANAQNRQPKTRRSSL
jgi:hypothetical protein